MQRNSKIRNLKSDMHLSMHTSIISIGIIIRPGAHT